MKKPHQLRAEARESGVRSEPSQRRRAGSEPPPSGRVAATDYQPSAFDDDLNNPLAVVLTNLDLLAELMARLRGDASQDGSLDAKTALAAHIAEAQSCVDDAREAGKHLRAVARRVKHASALPPPMGDPVPAPDKNVLRTARILIVDDDESLVRALERVFRGYDVVVHGSPIDALQKLTSGERFDVILSDFVMPGMSGLELHAEIRRFAPAQAERMVFLTGGCAKDDDAKALTATGQPVLSKPFDVRQLRAFVEKFME
jgi:CheY-like chemotaxis protein